MTESDGKGGWIPVWYKADGQLCYWWPTPTMYGYCGYCGKLGSAHVRVEPEEKKEDDGKSN